MHSQDETSRSYLIGMDFDSAHANFVAVESLLQLCLQVCEFANIRGAITTNVFV